MKRILGIMAAFIAVRTLLRKTPKSASRSTQTLFWLGSSAPELVNE